MLVAHYANIFVRDAWRLSPILLLALQAKESTLIALTVQTNDAGSHPAITDSSLNLTINSDLDSDRPSRIRAHEDHKIFSRSTSDLL